MDTSSLKRFEELCQQYETGDRESALRGLQDFARDIDEPWERTEIIYYETLWLLDLERVTEARASLERFREGVAGLVPEPPEDDTDDAETGLPVRLMVKMLFAEVKALFAESDNEGALQKLDGLLSRYPKRLSTEHFRGICQQLQTYRGLLLANLDRWDEAKPFLENAVSPHAWPNIVTLYLGQCYYSLGELLRREGKAAASTRYEVGAYLGGASALPAGHCFTQPERRKIG